jgi:hypothetical protein
LGLHFPSLFCLRASDGSLQRKPELRIRGGRAEGMMIRMALVVIVSGVAFAAGSARAQNPPAESPPAERMPAEKPSVEKPPAESTPAENAESRYTFSRVQDGYVRLDNRTGQVSFCSKRTVGWACQLVPEDRAAFENEIGRLQEENAVLKKDLLTRGLSLPGGVKNNPPLAQGDRIFKMPDDANLDRMRAFVEKLWRRLVDMIATLQRDMLKKS